MVRRGAYVRSYPSSAAGLPPHFGHFAVLEARKRAPRRMFGPRPRLGARLDVVLSNRRALVDAGARAQGPARFGRALRPLRPLRRRHFERDRPQQSASRLSQATPALCNDARSSACRQVVRIPLRPRRDPRTALPGRPRALAARGHRAPSAWARQHRKGARLKLRARRAQPALSFGGFGDAPRIAPPSCARLQRAERARRSPRAPWSSATRSAISSAAPVGAAAPRRNRPLRARRAHPSPPTCASGLGFARRRALGT